MFALSIINPKNIYICLKTWSYAMSVYIYAGEMAKCQKNEILFYYNSNLDSNLASTDYS